MSEESEVQVDEAKEKTFTQAELDKLISDRIARERKKYEKKYEGVDLETYSVWQEEKEQADIDSQKQRGEFDSILKNAIDKKDAEIDGLRTRISSTEIDGSLLASASGLNAVAPAQVASLLRENIKLSDDGKAEVIDADGKLRYNDSGEVMKPSDLVSEFLTANPHFVKATLGGSGGTGNAGGSTHKPKSVADMTQTEYRAHREAIGRK